MRSLDVDSFRFSVHFRHGVDEDDWIGLIYGVLVVSFLDPKIKLVFRFYFLAVISKRFVEVAFLAFLGRIE